MQLDTPPGVEREDVVSAADLAASVATHRTEIDALIMAAAVADFTAAGRAEQKIKKDESAPEAVPTLQLTRTEDVLRASVLARGEEQRPLIVGFAAETGGQDANARELAQAKARRKGADLLVFNDLMRGVFGAEDNAVEILDAQGDEVTACEGSKILVAHAVIDELARRLPDVPCTP